VSFNNIKISGALAATIDIVNNATFQGEASAFNANGSLNTASTLGVIPQFGADGTTATGKSTGLAAFAPTGDVVKIAIPLVDTTKNLAMSVDSIKMGGSDASFGKMEMKDIKLQGTTVYIWAH
jgi:hypothetical protein